MGDASRDRVGGPAEVTTFDAIEIVEHDALALQSSPLLDRGLASHADATAGVDDAMPRQCVVADRSQHRAHEPCASRQSGARGDLAIGRDDAGGDRRDGLEQAKHVGRAVVGHGYQSVIRP